MQVVSIAECSNQAFSNAFHLQFATWTTCKTFVLSNFERPLQTSFTVSVRTRPTLLFDSVMCEAYFVNSVKKLGFNCIKIFHLMKYIVGYTVTVWKFSLKVTGETRFPDRISDDIPPQMRILNMVIHILLHFCSLFLNWSIASGRMPHVIQRNMTWLMTSNFPTVYSRIYCHKCFTLSNQTSRYKSKCTRISVCWHKAGQNT